MNRIALFALPLTLILLAPAGAQDVSLSSERGSSVVTFHLRGESVIARATTAAVADLRVIGLAGWPGLAATWTETAAEGTQAWYAISTDGTRVDRTTPTQYDVLLRYDTFDPLLRTPQVPGALSARPGNRLWIVQWWTQGLETYRSAVRSLGADIHLYLGHHAQVVEVDASQIAALRNLPCVRWVGEFHPAYKLDAALLEFQRRGYLDQPSIAVNLLTTRRGPAGQGPVGAGIEALGGHVFHQSPETHLMSATLDLAGLVALARMDEVQWIDPWGGIGTDMAVARTFFGADYAEALGGLDGTGVRGEIHDVGTDLTHPELSGAIAHGAPGSASHGTKVAGEVFATGLDPQARGLCPSGTAIITDANRYVGSRYAHTMQSVDPSGIYQAVFLTSSVGNPWTTTYSSISQNLDLIVFDSHLLHCQSQSNQGTQMSRPEAWAKNVVSVGGVNHINTVSKADDLWLGASIGPAADGRIKPNFAAFYDAVYTTDLGGGYAAAFGGTSAATPLVGGAFGLFHQMWHAGGFGNPTGTSVFQSRPKETLARAMMTASATQWSFNGPSHNLTRVHQGWGHPDLKKLHDHRARTFWVNETDVLANLQSTEWNLDVLPGAPELKVALVWADPAGTTSSTRHRINDLDLKVTSPTGTVFVGNVGLLSANYSAAGGSTDDVNTEECVFVRLPAAGVWRVEVIAADVNQDGHVETTAIDVDYALAVLGAEGTPLSSAFDIELTSSGAGLGDGHLGLTAIPTGTTQGYCLFSFATSQVLGTGSFIGLVPDFSTWVCLASPRRTGSVLHWSWPAPSSIFPANDFDAPAGFFTLAAGTTMDGMAIALDASWTVRGTTPVRRVTF
ncbi:MAG: peptidase S8 [Planctomycetes bacterium]|nr:peptidase S8 [Planctomycetota bacterium]